MRMYYNVDPNGKGGKWLLNGFIIFGVIALIGAALSLAVLLKNRGDYEKIDGTILGFDSSGHPVVEYEVDGETYSFVSNTSSSTYRKGDSLSVLYKTADPADGKSAGCYYVLPIVLGGLGLGFSGVPLLIKAFTKNAKRPEEA